MELMKKTADDPYLGKMQVKNVSSPSASNKRKFRLKFPWKKHEANYDYETSEELDTFIQEVIEKAREEYFRECEAEKKGEIVERMDVDSEQHINSSYQEYNQKPTVLSDPPDHQKTIQNRTDDSRDRNRQTHEKKPLLSSNQTQQSEFQTTAMRTVLRRALVYMTCCYCHCFRESCDLT